MRTVHNIHHLSFRFKMCLKHMAIGLMLHNQWPGQFEQEVSLLNIYNGFYVIRNSKLVCWWDRMDKSRGPLLG